MAKMRLSFVTNSSSSSFIVAKRNDCTRKDIESLLAEKIEIFLKYDCEYCYDFNELIKEHGEELAIQVAKNRIIDELDGMGSMKLDDWKIESGKGSSEDDMFGSFMHSCDFIDGEKFKIGE